MPGKIVDEDAPFVKKVLDLPEEPWDLSPVIVTPDFLRAQLSEDDFEKPEILMDRIYHAWDEYRSECEVLLLEGGNDLQEGFLLGLITSNIADRLDGDILLVVKFVNEIRLIDVVLASKRIFKGRLKGLIINQIPEEAMPLIKNLVKPYFDRVDLPVFGMIPYVNTLASITVYDLISILEAEVLTKIVNPDTLVDELVIGTMISEMGIQNNTRQKNKAVITGGDRADIQVAALESSFACLILTGNVRPSPIIIHHADQLGIPILLVNDTSRDTMKKIDLKYGRHRLGQMAKYERYEKLFYDRVDLERLKQFIDQ
jgi:uncharacterized protein